MPRVKITDLFVHPRENDLVVASYGRGAWVTDVAILQEWKDSIAAEDAYLFNIEPRTQRA